MASSKAAKITYEPKIYEIQSYLSRKANILIEAAMIQSLKTSLEGVSKTLMQYFAILPRHFVNPDKEMQTMKRKLMQNKRGIYNYNITTQREELKVIHRNCEFILNGMKNRTFHEKEWNPKIGKALRPIFISRLMLSQLVDEKKRAKKSLKEREKAREQGRRFFETGEFGMVLDVIKANEETCNSGDLAEYNKKFKVQFTFFLYNSYINMYILG